MVEIDGCKYNEWIVANSYIKDVGYIYFRPENPYVGHAWGDMSLTVVNFSKPAEPHPNWRNLPVILTPISTSGKCKTLKFASFNDMDQYIKGKNENTEEGEGLFGSNNGLFSLNIPKWLLWAMIAAGILSANNASKNGLTLRNGAGLMVGSYGVILILKKRTTPTK